MKEEIIESFLKLVRAAAENAVEKYKDSISTGIQCGCPAEWPHEEEERLARELVDLLYPNEE